MAKPRSAQPSPAKAPPKRTRLPAAERKQQIIEAAERVFAAKSYWIATTEDVAREAGISQAAVFRYFDTKQALFLETLGWRQQALVAGAMEILSAAETPMLRLRGIARSLVELAFEHPEVGRLRVQAAAAVGDPQVREAVRSTLDTMMRLHQGLIRAAQESGEIRAEVDPASAASTLSGLAFIFYVAHSAGYEMATNQAAAIAVVENHLDSLAVPTDG